MRPSKKVNLPKPKQQGGPCARPSAMLPSACLYGKPLKNNTDHPILGSKKLDLRLSAMSGWGTSGRSSDIDLNQDGWFERNVWKGSLHAV